MMMYEWTVRVLNILLLVKATVQTSVITDNPGNFTARTGSTLTLTWAVSLPDSRIKWCSWWYKPRGANNSVNWADLIGWDNSNKQPIHYGHYLKDWAFISDKPCETGIRKTGVTDDYQGEYKFSVIEVGDDQHVSEPSSHIAVLEGAELTYTVAISSCKDYINNKYSYKMTVGAPHDTMPVKSVIANHETTLSASMDWDMASGNISFYKQMLHDQPEHLYSCQGHVCRKDVTLEDEENTHLIIKMHPNIQEVEPIVLTQPVLAIAAVPNKAWIPWLLFSLLLVIIVAGVSLLICHLRRCPGPLKKCEDFHILLRNHKPEPTGDDHKMSGENRRSPGDDGSLLLSQDNEIDTLKKDHCEEIERLKAEVKQHEEQQAQAVEDKDDEIKNLKTNHCGEIESLEADKEQLTQAVKDKAAASAMRETQYDHELKEKVAAYNKIIQDQEKEREQNEKAMETLKDRIAELEKNVVTTRATNKMADTSHTEGPLLKSVVDKNLTARAPGQAKRVDSTDTNKVGEGEPIETGQEVTEGLGISAVVERELDGHIASFEELRLQYGLPLGLDDIRSILEDVARARVRLQLIAQYPSARDRHRKLKWTDLVYIERTLNGNELSVSQEFRFRQLNLIQPTLDALRSYKTQLNTDESDTTAKSIQDKYRAKTKVIEGIQRDLENSDVKKCIKTLQKRVDKDAKECKARMSTVNEKINELEEEAAPQMGNQRTTDQRPGDGLNSMPQPQDDTSLQYSASSRSSASPRGSVSAQGGTCV